MTLLLPDKQLVTVDEAEAVQLGAVDSPFFSRSYFPQAARQESPPIHDQIWCLLDGPDRFVSILMARGWAKTTLLRIYTAKRIAYNISRSISYIGPSEKHARRSLRWLRTQIDKNARFAKRFGLRAGVPWTDEEMQIIHEVGGNSIWVSGAGITGNNRGINFEDYRPDLIVLDDIMNDENASSPEGREKISELVFGAIKKSLAPVVDSPRAKLVALNTPQDADDISQQLAKDREFVSARFGCWTPETEDLPLEFRKSAWEERVSTKELHDEYNLALERNRLSIFSREMECKLITPENAAFKPEWLQFFGKDEETAEPEDHLMWTLMVIDPVPPPSETRLAKGTHDGDFEAISVLGRYKGKIFVLDTYYNRGHTPSWTINTFFMLARKWRIRGCIVETVAYQQTLAWMLREAMKKAGEYYLVEEFKDRRPKAQRIVDGIQGIAGNRQLYFRRSQHTALDQYLKFSTIKKTGKDDVLETIAIGCIKLQNIGFNIPESESAMPNEGEFELLTAYRGAP